jgi:hypothetical protein
VHPLPSLYPKVPLLTAEQREGAEAELAVHPTILPPINPPILSFLLFQPRQSQLFQVSDHGAAHECCTAYLIKTLLKQGFETKLIATEASCSMRAVQRIRLMSQQSEMPTTPRTNRVGRRSCITPPMQKSLCDILTEQPYLYRCEMADFLFRRFYKRISDRSIGRTLRSIGWTRTTIRRTTAGCRSSRSLSP